MHEYKVNLNFETKKLEQLEEDLLAFANSYTLNKWRIPALISEDVLKKCGYFHTMPNQLTVAGFFDDSQCKIMQKDSRNIPSCSCSKFYFTPAACIHFYPELKKRNIYNELITTNARVYRHESGRFNSERMWDFNVREFVAVGSEKFVQDFLEDFSNKSLIFARKYDKKAELRYANDHFYPTKENLIKEKVQKANHLKKELIDFKGHAIASFNYHGYHFSKPFEFDKNGTIVSGCVGFGLDRWLTLINNGEGFNE